MMQEKPVVDPAALVRLQVLGGDGLLKEMIRLYSANARERLAQITAGLGPQGPLSEAGSGAHSLKSSAANVGALRVSELSAALEAAAGRGDHEATRELADALRTAVDDADARLDELVREMT